MRSWLVGERRSVLRSTCPEEFLFCSLMIDFCVFFSLWISCSLSSVLTTLLKLFLLTWDLADPTGSVWTSSLINSVATLILETHFPFKTYNCYFLGFSFPILENSRPWESFLISLASPSSFVHPRSCCCRTWSFLFSILSVIECACCQVSTMCLLRTPDPRVLSTGMVSMSRRWLCSLP